MPKLMTYTSPLRLHLVRITDFLIASRITNRTLSLKHLMVTLIVTWGFNLPTAYATWTFQEGQEVRPVPHAETQIREDITAYHLKSRLAVPGSFGEAHLAIPVTRDRNLEPVVLKYIKPAPDSQAEFDQEWSNMQQTKDLPHVVQAQGRMVASVFSKDGRQIGKGRFLILDFYGEGDLFDYIERLSAAHKAQTITKEDVLKIGMQLSRHIAAGLNSMHQKNIIHRDIKPENIFIKCTNSQQTCEPSSLEWEAYIGDLGFAKKIATPTLPSGKAFPETAKKAKGTIGFIPPERIAISPLPSFDSFSLGATINNFFYHTLGCGYHPDHLSTSWSNKDATNGFCPAELYELIASLLAKSPNERPAPAQVTASPLFTAKAPFWKHDCYCDLQSTKIKKDACVAILNYRDRTDKPTSSFCQRYARAKDTGPSTCGPSCMSGSRGWPSASSCQTVLDALTPQQCPASVM